MVLKRNSEILKLQVKLRTEKKKFQKKSRKIKQLQKKIKSNSIGKR